MAPNSWCYHTTTGRISTREATTMWYGDIPEMTGDMWYGIGCLKDARRRDNHSRLYLQQS